MTVISHAQQVHCRKTACTRHVPNKMTSRLTAVSRAQQLVQHDVAEVAVDVTCRSRSFIICMLPGEAIAVVDSPGV